MFNKKKKKKKQRFRLLTHCTCQDKDICFQTLSLSLLPISHCDGA